MATILWEGDYNACLFNKRQELTVEQSRLHEARFLDFLCALRPVIAYFVHCRTHWVHAHQPGVQGLQQITGLPRISDSRIEPEIVIVWFEDDRHSVVNVLEQGVGVCGQDRAGLDYFASRIFPLVPQSSKCKQSIVGHSDVEGLLLLGADLFPFVKPICRDQAAPLLHRLTEHWLLCCRLRYGINRLRT